MAGNNTLQGLPAEMQLRIVHEVVVANHDLDLPLFESLFDEAIAPFEACPHLESMASGEAMRKNTWTLTADAAVGVWTNCTNSNGAPLGDLMETPGHGPAPAPGPSAYPIFHFHDNGTTMDPRARHIRHLRVTAEVSERGAQPFVLRPHVLRLLQLLPLVFPRLATLDVALEAAAPPRAPAPGVPVDPEARGRELLVRVRQWAGEVSRACGGMRLHRKTLTLLAGGKPLVWGQERWDDGRVDVQGQWKRTGKTSVVLHLPV